MTVSAIRQYYLKATHLTVRCSLYYLRWVDTGEAERYNTAGGVSGICR